MRLNEPDGVTVGVVEAVNDDGTVSVLVRGGFVGSLPCDPSYTPRAVGDRVEVRLSKGLGFVLGKRAGPLPPAAVTPVAPWAHTLVNTAPGGTFEQAASVWVDPVTREVRYVRTTAAPPPPAPTTGQLVRTRVGQASYRGGQIVGDDRAEQGTWAGYGPHTGLFFFGTNAWAGLVGKTITRVRVRLHRRNTGGIIAAVPIYVGYHNAATEPSTVVSLTEVAFRLALARNQTKTVDLPRTWGERLRDGTAAGVGIYHATTNAELDSAVITVDYTN